MFSRKLPTICRIRVQTGERAGSRPLLLRSEGFLHFAIRPRLASPVVDLQLVDAEAHVDGFNVEIDGREVEVAEFTLTSADFDPSQSRGEVDQLTNEGWFRLVFTLRVEHAPALRGIVEGDEARIEIVERGHIDISRGRIIETHAEAFELPSAIPRSLVASIGRHQGRNSKGPSCDVDRVRLGAGVSGRFSASDVSDQTEQELVIVCPNTSVTLVWGSHDETKVRSGRIVDNESGTTVATPTTGSGTFNVRPANDAKYQLTITNPSCAPKSAEVPVVVVTPGKEITLAVPWDPYHGTATFKGDPKFIGRDVFVTSIKTIDCGDELSQPPVLLWDYEFTDVDGRVFLGQVDTTYRPLPGDPRDLPLSGCTWVFSPNVMVRDITLGVCFKVRCACHSG